MWDVGEVRLFRWAWGGGSPGLLVLLAFGWSIEAVDDRYGSVLMSLPFCSGIPVAGGRS